MQQYEPLENGKYYHIYNCGINGEDLFRESKNHQHFLSLYDKYVDPVSDTFAWCLMRNHFHLLVRVKEEGEIASFYDSHCQGLRPLAGRNETPPVVENPGGGGKDWRTRKPDPSNQLSHLFNSYAQYYNKKYKRHGSLFEKRFKRKHVNNEKYFRQLVVYIHNNPVHHGFVDYPGDYPWSSYRTCVSVKPTKLKRETVIGWFDGVANFKYVHEGKVEFLKIEEWLGV